MKGGYIAPKRLPFTRRRRQKCLAAGPDQLMEVCAVQFQLLVHGTNFIQHSKKHFDNLRIERCAGPIANEVEDLLLGQRGLALSSG